MIKPYLMKLSIRGKSHKKRGKKNEDYIIIKKLDQKRVLIIAADGVSSCLYGGKSSKMVVKCFYAFVRKDLLKCNNEEEIRNAFIEASNKTLACLNKVADTKGGLKEWGTTLEVGFFYDGVVYYWHCGDGAILSLREDGYVDITTNELHKGESLHSVVPFSTRESWEFGAFNENKSLGMAVMTDGVYELLRPLVIRNYGYEYEPVLFIPAVDRRCHNSSKKEHYKYISRLFNGVIKDDEAVGKLKEICKEIENELDDAYGCENDCKLIQDMKLVTMYETSVNDDMTIGLFVGEFPKVYMNIREPDYEWIMKEDFKKAYPQYF